MLISFVIHPVNKESVSPHLKCQLDQSAKEELQWWTHNLQKWNDRSNTTPNPRPDCGDRCICPGLGYSGRRRVYEGMWSDEEHQHYISYMQMLGEALAVQSSTKDVAVAHVCQKMDNQAAL